MTTISATSIASSVGKLTGDRVDTLLLRYPRWIHAEGRTHRLMSLGEDFEISVPTPSLMEDPNLSRNASSSRRSPCPGSFRTCSTIGRPAVLGQEPEGDAGRRGAIWQRPEHGQAALERRDAPCD